MNDDALNDRENHIGPNVICLSKTIRYVSNSYLLSKGELMTGEQCRIMSYICRKSSAGDNVFQKDIERDFNLKRSSVASILGNMEKGGYIVRSFDERDARIKKIMLTAKGHQLEKEMYENIIMIEKVLSEGMSEEERQMYIRLTKQAVKNLATSELLHGNPKQG